MAEEFIEQPQSTDPNLPAEGNSEARDKLWTTTIKSEAQLLLGKYLPNALPHEPTELMIDMQPFSIGKFKGKHYIALPNMTSSLAGIEKTKRGIERYDKLFEEWKVQVEADMKERMDFLESVSKRGEAGEILTDE